ARQDAACRPAQASRGPATRPVRRLPVVTPRSLPPITPPITPPASVAPRPTSGPARPAPPVYASRGPPDDLAAGRTGVPECRVTATQEQPHDIGSSHASPPGGQIQRSRRDGHHHAAVDRAVGWALVVRNIELARPADRAIGPVDHVDPAVAAALALRAQLEARHIVLVD